MSYRKEREKTYTDHILCTRHIMCIPLFYPHRMNNVTPLYRWENQGSRKDSWMTPKPAHATCAPEGQPQGFLPVTKAYRSDEMQNR